MAVTSTCSIFGEFFGHLSKRRRRQLGLLFLLMLAGALAEILTIGAVVPFLSLMARPGMVAEYPTLHEIFNLLGWQGTESPVLPMTAIFLGMAVLATGIRLLLLFAGNRLMSAIAHDIGVKLYRVVLHQPYAFHITRNTGDVIADVGKVQLLLGSVLRPAMDGLIAMILATAILMALMMVDAAIALGAGLMFGAIYLIVIRLFRSRLKANSRMIADTQGRRIRAVQEGLGGIRDVLLDGNQGHYVREFAKYDRDLREAQTTNGFLSQAPRLVIEAIGIVVIVALAYVLSLQPGGLAASLPVLGALALGAVRLLPLIQRIYAAWAQYTGNFNVFLDVLSALNLPMDGSRDATSPALPFDREIRLEGVCYRYSEDDPEVLSDISLTIPKGSRVGIVGRTGSGKSTLMDVLLGLLEPSSGRILIDGTALDADNRQAWQQHISHVPQHIYLADASIAENIALGVPQGAIDHDRVRRAAKQAHISGFVEASRQSYATRVGERGIQLSGGQRQRIGIARALYREAGVLVFDEASSALDVVTEAAVMQSMKALGPNLTVFLIAHRIQTLCDCDLIIQLESGRLIHTEAYGDNVDCNSIDIKSRRRS